MMTWLMMVMRMLLMMIVVVMPYDNDVGVSCYVDVYVDDCCSWCLC